MRAPIGYRISSRRHAAGVSQAALARRAGISASYLNLIERNKREVGGALLKRIAEAIGIDIGALTGESEQKLVHDLEEAFADPVVSDVGLPLGAPRDLVASNPPAAQAIARLHRAYQAATASAEDYANRLRADPLFSELLHQILSGITAVRSSAEILGDVPDLDDTERQRFLGSIKHEALGLSAVAQTLIGQFDRTSETHRSISPVRELDDLILAENNYFPTLESTGETLRNQIEAYGRFGETTLVEALARRFGVTVVRSGERAVDANGFPGQYHYNPDSRTMWFQSSAIAATRQFQLSRLYGELAAPDAIDAASTSPLLSTPAARRLAARALSSYLAGTMVFPYEAFLAEARLQRYDILALCQSFVGSFEQVAHRLVTLRRKDVDGVAFGFLRSDPAGRLTKHFPLPGLLLPNSGHACPLWAIYAAFRAPDQIVRQVVQFADGSRYMFIARASARRVARFTDQAVPTSVMLACNVLHADATVYADGLDLGTTDADVPVGPSCRMCTRHDCASRQEEVFAPGGTETAIRAPLVPRPSVID